MDRDAQKQPKTDSIENLPEQKDARDQQQQQPSPEQEERVKGGLASSDQTRPEWFKRA
jgi:hypothetical protein